MNETKWGQKNGFVIVTISVIDTDNPQVVIEENKLIYNNGNNEFKLDLYQNIDTAESHWEPHGREVRVHLKKTTEDSWPRLTAEKAKYGWLSVDWRYIDDSDESEDDYY
eukprot:TRINITY_DN1833_c0_g1_i2.p1 TRINITY_DN1833_c0_g1~~TRINITY_DN1833_c0_g1_i2.p1  ORF type:complete len:121 (+),score=29.89 TRINITY_DN1833_c0_g1_i2:39-365(+)